MGKLFWCNEDCPMQSSCEGLLLEFWPFPILSRCNCLDSQNGCGCMSCSPSLYLWLLDTWKHQWCRKLMCFPGLNSRHTLRVLGTLYSYIHELWLICISETSYQIALTTLIFVAVYLQLQALFQQDLLPNLLYRTMWPFLTPLTSLSLSLRLNSS